MEFLGRAAILGVFIGFQSLGCAHIFSKTGDSEVSITVSASRGGRTIDELDWNRDGKVTGHDVKLIEATAAATVSRLEEAPFDGFVMPRHKETTLKLTKNGEGYVVESAGGLSQYETAVEMRWLVGQARIATSVAGAISGNPISGILRDSFPGYLASSLEPSRVCASLGQWDLQSFREAGLRPIAVFDLDGTVWSGHVIDGFLGALAESDLVVPEQNGVLKAILVKVPELKDKSTIRSNSVQENVKLLMEYTESSSASPKELISKKDSFFATAELLKGLTPESVALVARQAFNRGSASFGPWKNRIFQDDTCSMNELIRTLKGNGIDIYFLSAGLEPTVRAAAEYFGIPLENAIGSHLIVKDGKYTGEVLSNYAVKASVVRQRLPNPPLVVVGNSARSDFGMMEEALGVVLMINPDQALKEREQKEARGIFVELLYP